MSAGTAGPRTGCHAPMEILASYAWPRCQIPFARSGIGLDICKLPDGVVLIRTVHLKDVQ
jgi:hypothetical protein